MAERPVFIAASQPEPHVESKSLNIRWNSGFAKVQKQKNIKALHEAAWGIGLKKILEVSTKSEIGLGRRLSAFSLKITVDDHVEIPLECAFQGSKVFRDGGPYTDLYFVDPKNAKRDLRLKESGPLTGFSFSGVNFPIDPKSAFYDWLYISALLPYKEFLVEHLLAYEAFTDIEFNPKKSINCQARSCALLVLLLRNMVDVADLSDPISFLDLHEQYITDCFSDSELW